MKGLYVETVALLPDDPLFALKAAYTVDERPYKVDLGIGAYRDENAKPWILPSVRLAENLVQNSADYNHEYLPLNGFADFYNSAARIILGEDSRALKENRVVSTQSLSGTGALHVAGMLLKNCYRSKDGAGDEELPTVYLSTPTWGNHYALFGLVGFKAVGYPYWVPETKSLDIDGFVKTIEDAPEGSIFVLHAVAHNPTGLDPTHEQWERILQAISRKHHLPLFDSAYQGFSSGSLAEDAWAVRHAINSTKYDFPAVVVCQSFSKNVGMYGERTGAVHIIPSTANEDLNKAIKSQMANIIRSEISNAPAYGAKIVSKILNTPELYTQWEQDLVTMSSRIKSMRHALVDELQKLNTPGSWTHITDQQGMFSFTGLNPEQVELLKKNHAVYLAKTGRASIAGLNPSNVTHVAKAIDTVVRETQK